MEEAQGGVFRHHTHLSTQDNNLDNQVVTKEQEAPAGATRHETHHSMQNHHPDDREVTQANQALLK